MFTKANINIMAFINLSIHVKHIQPKGIITLFLINDRVLVVYNIQFLIVEIRVFNLGS